MACTMAEEVARHADIYATAESFIEPNRSMTLIYMIFARSEGAWRIASKELEQRVIRECSEPAEIGQHIIFENRPPPNKMY
jgi:hypothetical protein